MAQEGPAITIITMSNSSGPLVRIPTEEILHGIAGWVWDLWWPFWYFRFDNCTVCSISLGKLTLISNSLVPWSDAGLKHSLNNQPTNQTTFTGYPPHPCNCLCGWKMNPIHIPYSMTSFIILLVPYYVSLSNFWMLVTILNHYLWFPIPTYHFLWDLVISQLLNFCNFSEYKYIQFLIKVKSTYWNKINGVCLIEKNGLFSSKKSIFKIDKTY